MANETLTTTGRISLDRPPAPTTPPEAAPRVAQLNQAKEESNPASIGSLQQSGIVLQIGMAVEKGLLSLASLVPGLDDLVQQILPQIRSGITAGLASGGSSQGGGPAVSGGEELPAQAVTPLQQG